MATRHSAAENECKSTEAMLASIDAQAQLGEAGLGRAAAAREVGPDLQGRPKDRRHPAIPPGKTYAGGAPCSIREGVELVGRAKLVRKGGRVFADVGAVVSRAA